jgi:hypothetical protein
MIPIKKNLLLLLVALVLFGCKKEEPNLDVVETLTSGSWIMHSYLFDQTNQYEEFAFKDEYEFFDNGNYNLTRRVTYFNDNNEIVSEFVTNEYDWLYDEENGVVDFKINDNPPENTLVDQPDWKILEVSSSKIFVECIWPNFVDPLQQRIMLVKK